MVSLGPRLALPLALALTGCAGPAADLETTRQRAICALSEVDGRLDLVPAGPGAVGARLVTLDRDQALAAVRDLDEGRPTGIARVRIEPPRPMIAMVLRWDVTAPGPPPPISHPITVALAQKPTDPKPIETWVRSFGGTLTILEDAGADALPVGLDPEAGVDLRHATGDLVEALVEALALAEAQGAAWVLGELDRRTLAALRRFLGEHSESLHLVALGRVAEPPTAPEWLRRCSELPIED